MLCAILLHKGDNYSRRDIPNGRDWGTAPADYSRFLRPKTWCSARNTLTPRGENIITFIYDAKSPTPVPPRAIPVPKTGAFAGSLVDEKITDKNIVPFSIPRARTHRTRGVPCPWAFTPRLSLASFYFIIVLSFFSERHPFQRENPSTSRTSPL